MTDTLASRITFLPAEPGHWEEITQSANIAGPFLAQQARRNAPAILLRKPGETVNAGPEGYSAISVGELLDSTQRAAAGLAQLSILPGTRVALMVPPSPDLIRLVYALFQVGAIPVLIDPGMGLRNIGKCLAEAEPTVFIGIPKAHIARSLARWGKSTVRQLITVGRSTGWWGGSRFSEVMNAGNSQAVPFFLAKSSDPAAILFTSGSTGVPKGAVYTHGLFQEQIRQLRQLFQIEPGEVDLCTFPLFALFAPALGMTSIIPQMDATRPARVHPPEILEPLRKLGVTNLFGSPALLNRVGRAGCPVPDENVPTIRLPHVKRVLSAGAPVSPQILERFQKLLPESTQIFTPYGATEALPVAVIGSREILDDTRHQTALGAGTCVGRPVPDLDVKIIQISDQPIAQWSEELVLPIGEIGEIAVKGRQVSREYFRRPDLTALAKIAGPGTDDLWHRMGDCGYFDADGRLWFCGRKSQRVVTAERTYFTDPIEGIFNQHPQVFRSALVGVNTQAGKRPVVCIECEPGVSARQRVRIHRELITLASQHALTQPLQTILFHPAFPVDIRHNSKIFREKLAMWAERQRV